MVLGYTQGKRIDWFHAYLVKLVVRPWNCFNRFVYILFLAITMSKASTIETCLYRRENGPKNWKRRFLTWKAVFFQVPVTFCRSISGCNYFAPGLCIDEPSRGYSFMFEQLRVSDRFGISDMSIFWSFLIWGTCLSVQDVCRFFFFFETFSCFIWYLPFEAQ